MATAAWGTMRRTSATHAQRPSTDCLPLFSPLLHHGTSCCLTRFSRTSPVGMPWQGGGKMTMVWAQRHESSLNDCVVSPEVCDHMVDPSG